MMRFVATGITMACLCIAQAQPPQTFEVASIKPNHSGSTDSNVDSTKGGRLTVTNDSLKELIKLAFGVKDYQISGAPGWTDSERYDIAAKTADSQNLERKRPCFARYSQNVSL